MNELVKAIVDGDEDRARSIATSDREMAQSRSSSGGTLLQLASASGYPPTVAALLRANDGDRLPAKGSEDP